MIDDAAFLPELEIDHPRAVAPMAMSQRQDPVAKARVSIRPRQEPDNLCFRESLLQSSDPFAGPDSKPKRYSEPGDVAISQPSRVVAHDNRFVCIGIQKAYASLSGFKVVTPALSACNPVSVVQTSDTRPACVGTGFGVFTTFDSGCPF